MDQQIRVIFIGRVQGVGFRFTALHIAGNMNLLGWVRNLPNGSVEMLAEGPKEQLEKLVQQLQQNFSVYINDTKIQWGPATGDHKTFSIAR